MQADTEVFAGKRTVAKQLIDSGNHARTKTINRVTAVEKTMTAMRGRWAGIDTKVVRDGDRV